jgi:beta-galactosidase
MELNRRTFLRAGTALCFTGVLPLFAAVEQISQQNDPVAASRKLTDGWEFYRGPLDPAFQVWHSEELVSWEKVTLPHCFNHYDACDPDVPAYRGEAWYRSKLAVQNPYRNGRTLLHFEGAGQSSKIYIGTSLVGEHIGGYDEFVVDISQAVAGSTAVNLAVLCDNGRDLSRMPSDLSDFTLYGGLYRAVHLVYLPPASFEAVHTNVQYQRGGPAEVSVTARLYAPDGVRDPLSISIRVTGPDGKEVHRGVIRRNAWQGEAELLGFTIADPVLWSPDEPNLYNFEIAMESGGQTATVTHRFGVRHIYWEERGPFYLNGTRLLLRGTQRHEDHAHYAAAMPDDLIRKELLLCKQMGANFLRLAHYQQSRLVLDLCDELGILVWEELPWCRSGVVNEVFKQRGRVLMTNMIDQHKNHPCVLLWGLGNEDDWPGEPQGDAREAIRAYMTELRDLSHKLDASRMTSYRRCDFACDIPDVYSPSIWAGWYSGRYTEYQSALEKARSSVKHFVHAEWGADSHAGRHAEDADPALAALTAGHGTAEIGFDYKLTGGPVRMAKDGEWSETYACDLFDWYLKTQEELPWLTGAAHWAFKDFTTPLRVENPVPRVNQKGLLTRDMEIKEGYYVFQSYWAKEPMLRVYGHDWPVRWGEAGQQRMVRVYSNCSEVELFLNGRSVGKKHRLPSDFPCSGLRWNLAFDEGQNELRAVASGAGKQLEDSVSFRYETRKWKKPERLMLSSTAVSEHRSLIRVELVDEAGVCCLDARDVITYSLAGSGRLVDNLGTPTGSRVVQLRNGRSQILVEHTQAIAIACATKSVPSATLLLSV